MPGKEEGESSAVASNAPAPASPEGAEEVALPESGAAAAAAASATTAPDRSASDTCASSPDEPDWLPRRNVVFVVRGPTARGASTLEEATVQLGLALNPMQVLCLGSPRALAGMFVLRQLSDYEGGQRASFVSLPCDETEAGAVSGTVDFAQSWFRYTGATKKPVQGALYQKRKVVKRFSVKAPIEALSSGEGERVNYLYLFTLEKPLEDVQVMDPRFFPADDQANLLGKIFWSLSLEEGSQSDEDLSTYHVVSKQHTLFCRQEQTSGEVRDIFPAQMMPLFAVGEAVGAEEQPTCFSCVRIFGSPDPAFRNVFETIPQPPEGVVGDDAEQRSVHVRFQISDWTSIFRSTPLFWGMEAHAPRVRRFPDFKDVEASFLAGGRPLLNVLKRLDRPFNSGIEKAVWEVSCLRLTRALERHCVEQFAETCKQTSAEPSDMLCVMVADMVVRYAQKKSDGSITFGGEKNVPALQLAFQAWRAAYDFACAHSVNVRNAWPVSNVRQRCVLIKDMWTQGPQALNGRQSKKGIKAAKKAFIECIKAIEALYEPEAEAGHEAAGDAPPEGGAAVAAAPVP